MKIILVSKNTNNFVSWTEQLKDSGHDLYWFDILDSGYSQKLNWVNQKIGWKQKFPNLKGRYFVKKNLPFIYNLIKPILERNLNKEFERFIQEVNPDLVHSFELQNSCTQISPTMNRNRKLQWICSSWGKDLFNYKDSPNYRKQIQRIFTRLNYLITDCQRDIDLAKNFEFKNKLLGSFPRGGGIDNDKYRNFINKPASERRTILVNGIQGKFGNAIAVIKALEELSKELKNYKVIVFNADKWVLKYCNKVKIENILNISIYINSKLLPHEEVMRLLGESLIYINNNSLDGLPSTLLESISMGAFPIHSNPGGVAEEVITNNENGLLIKNCEDFEEIKGLIQRGLASSKLIEKAFIINQMEIKSNYEREKIKQRVLTMYTRVSNNMR